MEKTTIGLLMSGVLVSLALFPSAVLAQKPVTETQVNRMVEALRKAAPQTKNPRDGLYSAWKVKPETLKGWTKTCLKRELTPSQFENDPKIARQVVSCITRRELNQQFHATKNNEIAAVRGVACWWMTGSYKGCDTGFTAAYVQKVVQFYLQSVNKV